MSRLTAAEVARRAGITPSTLRRWNDAGLIPRADGHWHERDIPHLRMLAGLRRRGHSIAELREGVERGTLVTTFLDVQHDPSSAADEIYTLRQAARRLELEPELLRRFMTAFGMPLRRTRLTEVEFQMLSHSAAVLRAGMPLVAALQILRVYSHATRQIADAEVRLVHLYVHEPMLRDGVDTTEIGRTLDSLSQRLLPLASPMLDLLHQRFLQHFIEQDVVGHLEQAGGDDSVRGEMRVAVAFADLAGFTQLTDQEGDLEAVGVAERFFEQVEQSIPFDARVIKTIGDEVMIVGSDGSALIDWAVRFQDLRDERPLPRISVHAGPVIFRDGDYYGREVNRAARMVGHGEGGQVVISGELCKAVGPGLRCESIGRHLLKGFEQPDELFVVEREPEY